MDMVAFHLREWLSVSMGGFLPAWHVIHARCESRSDALEPTACSSRRWCAALRHKTCFMESSGLMEHLVVLVASAEVCKTDGDVMVAPYATKTIV